ncbi:MAG: methylamine utilization protein [Candidatus Riflebacteria bacterium HGW-Riflebacteria-1]|nr:MAG: methylamine utilization protein [Candidatus Riflebacteria bacterium HGW-Riflebacteria-1]
MRYLIKIIVVYIFLMPLMAFAGEIEARFLDDRGRPVAEAVISAIPLSGQAVPAMSKIPVELEQIDKEFKPNVTIIQRGGKILFPNRDSVSHHVYSFSEAKKFELPLYTGASRPIVFENPGVITLGCNIHDWMKGYIVVVDTPFFALSDATGVIAIKDLPVGAWRLEVWHPRLKGGLMVREVNLTDGAALNESFTLSLRREWKKTRDRAREKSGY